MKLVITILLGLFVGIGLAYIVLFQRLTSSKNIQLLSPLSLLPQRKQVIGFLPYWLLDKAQTNYSQDITTLTYFGLQIGPDGNLNKYSAPGELEPGWNALLSGKVDSFLRNAKQNNVKRSLLIDSGDADTITAFITTPIASAQNLVKDITPILSQYNFTDLNLDIEDVQEASAQARMHFTQFVQEVRNKLDRKVTLTVEISPTDAIKSNLVNVKMIADSADFIIIMTYDYHFPNSFVTGPVAPIGGGSTISEFDVTQAVTQAKRIIPYHKLILGIPLYGYAWETLANTPRSAVIARTGTTASSKRVQDILTTCATCSATTDTDAQEKYIIYFDSESNTYHQIFYPDASATRAKIVLAKKEDLGGIALWALGYEGNDILQPLKELY